MKKLIQLKNLIQIRFGIIIVGVANCGKTTLINLLKNHSNRNYTKGITLSVETYILNPKAIEI